jgi:hypothetical protein
MSDVANFLVKQYLAARMPRIRQMKADAPQFQAEIFNYLLSKAADTQIGRQYGFSAISNYEQFKQQVPVHEYDDIKQYFDKCMQGEADVLWPGVVKWFSKSSGTTGDKSKFIPVTDEAIYQSHVKVGKDMMAEYYDRTPGAKVFSGKGLMLGGSLGDNIYPHPAHIGDVSGILIHQLPEWLHLFTVPEREIALMKVWEEKIEALANSLVKADVTNVSGVPTWMLMVFKRMLELTGKQNIKQVWPNLEVFFHGGVSFAPYRSQFEMLIGEPINYVEAYNASEGYFAYNDGAEGMLLHTGAGIFYEFISMRGGFAKTNEAVQLKDVVVGENYAVAISTNAGLWRYLTGDTVKFVSTAPYRIEITGRTKHFINVFGEEVMVDNTDKALTETCTALHCKVKDYTVAPVYLTIDNSGAHEWLIEFEKEPEDIAVFADLLDVNLQKANSDYEAKRAGDIAIKKLVLRKASEGTFYRWLKAKGKLGGQNKIPRLYNTRLYIDDIAAFV